MQLRSLVIALGCLQPILAASSPIIVNGDFETGSLTPWQIHRSTTTSSGNSAKAAITKPGLNSTYAAGLSVTQGSAAYPQSVVSIQQTFNVTPGQYYVLGYAYNRLAGGTGLTYLQIGITNGSSATVTFNGSQPDTYAKKPGQWNQLQSLFVPGGSTATFLAALHSNGTKSAVRVSADQFYLFPIQE